jgi:pyridoxal phosphate enzyme (YggS family)
MSQLSSQTAAVLRQNLTNLLAKREAAASESRRDASDIHLLAVSKKQPASAIREVYDAGLPAFGENYVQEALDKQEELKDLAIDWHFIGPIQSNKTRDIANGFSWVHSVDRPKVAQRLSAQRESHLPALNVCVQVNLSGEASKSGVALNEVEALCQLVSTLPSLRLRGLMAIPEALESYEAQRACFAPLRGEFERLQNQFPSLDTLSIGMSGDFEAAIAEGSTLVRIGTALFGQRR